MDLVLSLSRSLRCGWLHTTIADVVMILAIAHAGVTGDCFDEVLGFLGEIVQEAA